MVGLYSSHYAIERREQRFCSSLAFLDQLRLDEEFLRQSVDCLGEKRIGASLDIPSIYHRLGLEYVSHLDRVSRLADNRIALDHLKHLTSEAGWRLSEHGKYLVMR